MTKLLRMSVAMMLGFLAAAFIAPLIVEAIQRLSPTYYIRCDVIDN